MPNRYPENTRSILCTNVNGGDDVMVFTTLDVETLKAAYAGTSVTFDEMYEVPEQDQSLYIWEPCWLTIKEEARARELAIANVQPA